MRLRGFQVSARLFHLRKVVRRFAASESLQAREKRQIHEPTREQPSREHEPRTNRLRKPLRKLSQLDARPTPAVPKVVPQKPRLSNFLQPEIKEGLLSVDDYPDRSVVVIKSDGFFDPGKAQIAAPVVPLLGRIAAALNQLPGAITVVGHTDNRPIHSGLFANNQVLSQRRAEAVAGELAKTVPPTRMHVEGHSDSEPVTDNATTEGRARNRRVEITLNQPQEAK